MAFVWVTRPTEVWGRGAVRYEAQLERAITSLMLVMAARIEADAKNNAPWQDQTGNARQGLNAAVMKDGKNIRLVLRHLIVSYGPALELARGGKYAIIMPTLESHYGDIMKAVRDLLR